jgi:hypothetical protein
MGTVILDKEIGWGNFSASSNIDGGSASTIYLSDQLMDGGNA